VDKALGLLTWLGDVAGFRMEFVETPAGDRVQKETGHALPDDSFKKIAASDACLKGPVGETARDVIVFLRQRLDLYAKHQTVQKPPRGQGVSGEGVDLVIVREKYRGLV
jgi:3-isopropylmalate dehydrogenase